MDTQKSNLNKDSKDEKYKVLYDRVLQMKMDELFSEPYDGDMEEEDI
jgi:hypothetical protein